MPRHLVIQTPQPVALSLQVSVQPGDLLLQLPLPVPSHGQLLRVQEQPGISGVKLFPSVRNSRLVIFEAVKGGVK